MSPAGRDKNSGSDRHKGDLSERAGDLGHVAPAKHLHPKDLEHESAPDEERGNSIGADPLGDCSHVAASPSSSGNPPPIATPASANRT